MNEGKNRYEIQALPTFFALSFLRIFLLTKYSRHGIVEKIKMLTVVCEAKCITTFELDFLGRKEK